MAGFERDEKRAKGAGQVPAEKPVEVAAGAAIEKPVRGAAGVPARPARGRSGYAAEFLRAENEDDDGYDPYSDRRSTPEPLFERDPWS